MKMSARLLTGINQERHAVDPRHAVIDAAWSITEYGPCFDTQCQYGHRFAIFVGIARNEGDDYPHARLMVEEDDDWLTIRLSKAAIAELIVDLQSCLDELP